MARARNLKPGLFKNELLGVADPFVTLLFESLWCLADKAGRLEDRPLRIKAETFPYRDGLDVNVYLTELERLGFICRYVVDGMPIIQVLNFAKHQNPHKTERASELPEMPEKSISCTLTVNVPLKNGSRPADSLVLIPDSLVLIPEETAPQAASAKAPKFEFEKKLIELGADQKVVSDWMQVREKKKGQNTQTAFDGFVREAGLAGLSIADAVLVCAERSWCGINAEWLRPKAQGSPQGYESAKDRSRREASEQLTGRGKNDQRHDIIDITPSYPDELG